jgi:hypothetical protein
MRHCGRIQKAQPERFYFSAQYQQRLRPSKARTVRSGDHGLLRRIYLEIRAESDIGKTSRKGFTPRREILAPRTQQALTTTDNSSNEGILQRVHEDIALSQARMVGASRFERPTSRTPSECATRLRYAPTDPRFG